MSDLFERGKRILKDILEITEKEREAILSWNIDELIIFSNRKGRLIEEFVSIEEAFLRSIPKEEEEEIKGLIEKLRWNNLRLKFLASKASDFVDDYLRMVRYLMGIPYGADDKAVIGSLLGNCDLRG
ncbi:MAG: hypothetical protein ACP5K0_01695 [Thermosulfidibacteraceae bacterium]